MTGTFLQLRSLCSLVCLCLCAGSALGDDFFPLEPGADLSDTNIWNIIVGRTVDRELAISTVSGTNVSFPSGYNRIELATTGTLTAALLADVDAAILSMYTNFIDERYDSPAEIESFMARPVATNWYWNTNSLRWVEDERGIEIDHYVYPTVPPRWTASNWFAFAGAGTVLTWKVTHTNTLTTVVPGWQVGQPESFAVTNVQLGYTTTVERALLLERSTNYFKPVVMGELRCMITQAVRLVASGFGDPDGQYDLSVTDTNGFGTWVNSSNSACSIVQTAATEFIMMTNSGPASYLLSDTSGFRDFSSYWVGLGRGVWHATNGSAVGRTKVVGGNLGWRWTSWWNNWRYGIGSQLPIFGMPTQYLGKLSSVLILPTNAPEAVSPAIPVIAAGMIWTPGVTYPGPFGGETNTAITQLVSSVTQTWGELIYDIDSLEVQSWSEAWSTNSEPSFLGASLQVLYTNVTPFYGTPSTLTAEALNEREAVLGVMLRTWRPMQWGTGTEFFAYGDFQTNEAVCGSPALEPGEPWEVASVTPSLYYYYEYECASARRTHPPSGTLEEDGYVGRFEYAGWFEGVCSVTGLVTNFVAEVGVYQALRPSVFDGRPRSFAHGSAMTATVSRCVYEAVCSGCPNGYAQSCVTNKELKVVWNPYQGITAADFTFRNLDIVTKPAGASNFVVAVVPDPPSAALRPPSVVDLQSGSCVMPTNFFAPAGCGSFSFSDSYEFSHSEWGYDYLTPLAIIQWQFGR